MRSDARLFALALGLACVALPVHADWKRDYDRGTRAFEKQSWSEAEAAFRAALNEDPVPEARKRFQGVRTAVYVPHYYAGVAAWRQGACERAMQYWSNAASTAVVAGIAKLDAEQERGVSDCRRRLAGTAPAAPATGPAKVTPPPATGSPSKPLNAPVVPPSTIQNKPALAATTQTQGVPPRTPPTAPAATPTKPAASATVPASTGVPAALAGAVESYLTGQYPALLQLDPVSFADGRSRAQAYLLRAASRHATALLDGSGDAQTEAIQRDIRAARAANASLVPDAALFSPRFRALWQQTR